MWPIRLDQLGRPKGTDNPAPANSTTFLREIRSASSSIMPAILQVSRESVQRSFPHRYFVLLLAHLCKGKLMPLGDEDAVPLEPVIPSRFWGDGAVDGAFEVKYLLAVTKPYL